MMVYCPEDRMSYVTEHDRILITLHMYLEDPSIGVLAQYKGHPFNYVLG